MSSRVSIQQIVSTSAPVGVALGDEWLNPTTGVLYKRTLVNGVVDWLVINGSSAAAVGSGTNQVFFQNDQTVTGNYSIPSGKNAGSFGPITVNSGVTVTIPTGSVWTIV